MKSHFNRIISVLLYGIIACVLLSPLPTLAMEQGLYFGFGGNYHTLIGGDFDGEHFYRPADWSYAVDSPKPETAAPGLAGRIGLKAQFWALDFQYSQTILPKVESSFASPLTEELTGNMYFSFFDLNAKYYLFEEFRAGMYLILGASYSVMTGEKIKWTEGDYYSTASYSGVSANFGIGMDYYLTHNVFLYGEYMYRLNGYTMIEDLELPDTEDAPFHALFFGICYAISQ